ncbi:histone-like nucleoid-structuring protein Lsr2 [Streptomyces sp. NPDC056549]|uniref:Lsr2 family DNA-binding protein n=1 Tax=Streptomyces sp. NPDC056549 TaxID=3345864 RepID=UPI00368CD27D
MTSIDRLTDLCPPPPTALSTNWSSTEQALGMQLPTDYKQIADTYGPGAFCGFLHLYHPYAPTQWTSLTGPMSATIRTQLQHDRDSGTHPVPHDPRHLFAIGVTDNGEYLFWLTEPADAPEKWTIAGTEARGPRWFTYAGGLADFLTAVLSGCETVPLFPDSLLAQGVFFSPTTAAPTSTSVGTAAQPPAGMTADSRDIRAWARANGYDVPDRGRIPVAILEAWENPGNG